MKQKQPMPLYRKVLGGFPLTDAAFRQFIPNFDRRVIARAVPFHTQVAADIFWRGDQDWYTFKEVGPLRLPFPAIWMEWEVPEGSKIGGEELGKDFLIGIRTGVLITSTPQIPAGATGVGSESVPELSEGAFDSTLFTVTQSGVILVWPSVMRLTVDADGIYTGHAFMCPEGLMSRADQKNMADSIGMFIVPMVIGLGLINCRNVTSRPAGELVIPRKQTNRRHKDRGGPIRVEYHTIVLPGGVEHSSSGRRTGSGEVPVHRVRGHFKTYTADRPLLGKHVGTYWWGWNVRGNPEHGTVVSDYELQGAAE